MQTNELLAVQVERLREEKSYEALQARYNEEYRVGHAQALSLLRDLPAEIHTASKSFMLGIGSVHALQEKSLERTQSLLDAFQRLSNDLHERQNILVTTAQLWKRRAIAAGCVFVVLEVAIAFLR